MLFLETYSVILPFLSKLSNWQDMRYGSTFGRKRVSCDTKPKNNSWKETTFPTQNEVKRLPLSYEIIF